MNIVKNIYLMKKVAFLLVCLTCSQFLNAQNFQSFDLQVNTEANPRQMVQLGDKVVFFAYTDTTGEELFAYDHLTQTVSLVKDITAGPSSSTWGYTEYIVFQNKLFFTANDSIHGIEVWVTDGTPNGTFLLKDINPGVDDAYPGQYFIYNNRLYFTAQTANEGQELWYTDGTSAGTNLLIDINPGVNGSYPVSFIICNNQLYFSAYHDNYGSELWKTDGTPAGTQLVKDITGDNNDGVGYSPFGPFCLNNQVIFVGQDTIGNQELWITDGTAAGTQQLKDINPGANSSYPSYFIGFQNYLYFAADDGTHGQELWRTDGTPSGTVLVKDIKPGTDGSYPYNFFVADTILLFSAEASTNDREVWKTNGSQTSLLKNIHPASSYPENFIAFQNKVYFTAEDATNGKELWVTDGTTAGTQLFKNINTNIFAGSYPHSFTVHGNQLFFIADTGPINNENYQLFVTDGTPAGTTMIAPQASTNPFNSWYFPFYLTSTSYGLFFKAAFSPINQFELWRYYSPNTSLSSPTNIATFKCYPNPYQDVIHCECNQNDEIQVFNLHGKLLFKTQVQKGINEIKLADFCEPVIIRTQNESTLLLPGNK